jgi:hypothetical protein
MAAAVSLAKAQELEWATRAGGASSDEGFGIATDQRGNTYVAGQFQGNATFGMGEANETSLRAVGSGDLFVAKYAPDGTLLWATSAGGSSGDRGDAIATDPRGNSYVTGDFQRTVTFGEGENATSLQAEGETDVFVAKYAPDGTLLWATSAGGASSGDAGLAIATDRRGSSYATGIFSGTATFGAGEAKETVLETEGGIDVFVAKYAPDGTLLWATSAGGPSNDFPGGIATDRRGNSYVAGSFWVGPARFGEGEANETVLEAVGLDDVFVAKYAPDGTLLWATSAGGASNNSGNDIATDPRGNSYVTGWFRRNATFGAGEANEILLEADFGLPDLFVAKYAPDGTLLWATSARSTDSARSGSGGAGIAIDPRGNSYVTGSLGGTATFGAGEANETVLEAVGLADVFVVKYAPDGTLTWATSSRGVAGPPGRPGGYADGVDIATGPHGGSYVTGIFAGTATFGAGEANENALKAVGSTDVFVAKYGDRNDQDQCPDSDASATVVIDGNDTGVENALTDTGCTILDLIRQASDDAADHAEFIRGVALLTRTLLRDGLITAEEAGILRTAASQAMLPLS